MTSIELAAPLERRLDEAGALIAQVREALRMELARGGFAEALGAVPAQLQRCELRRDAFDSSEALYGEWLDAQGSRLGSLLLHAGGQVYAEFDVLRGHPTDRRWFVEAVTAWGRAGALKSELRLLPALPQ